MPTLTDVDAVREQTQDYITLGVLQLQQMLDAIADQQPAQIQQTVTDALQPIVIDPYAQAISDMTTDFYLADRARQGVRGRYNPPPGAGMPGIPRISSLIGWALDPMVTDYLEDKALAAVQSRLTGGLKGLLGAVQRNGIRELMMDDPKDEHPRYQRMAQAGCFSQRPTIWAR